MRSKTILLLSLVLGIVTTLLFYQYMKQIKSGDQATLKFEEVLVAKKKINKNEKITPDKLEVVQMPESSVLPPALKSPSEADGKLATSTIEKGEPILSTRLGSEKDEGVYVSRKVRENYRAISIGVNINQSVTNLIEPEDEVDVVFTKTTKTAEGQITAQSQILLSKVRVLAVGRKMQTPDDKKEPYAEYSSVTLELTPEDAIKVLKATEEGKIHLILHKRPIMNKDNQINQNQ